MTILNKVRIAAAASAILLGLIWIWYSSKQPENKELSNDSYQPVQWLPDKELWLSNIDSNEQDLKDLQYIDKIEAVRVPEKIQEPNEIFAPREAVKTQKFHIITNDDTLSSISEKYYGTSRNWRKIFEANRESLIDPDVLPIGTKILIP